MINRWWGDIQTCRSSSSIHAMSLERNCGFNERISQVFRRDFTIFQRIYKVLCYKKKKTYLESSFFYIFVFVLNWPIFLHHLNYFFPNVNKSAKEKVKRQNRFSPEMYIWWPFHASRILATIITADWDINLSNKLELVTCVQYALCSVQAAQCTCT